MTVGGSRRGLARQLLRGGAILVCESHVVVLSTPQPQIVLNLPLPGLLSLLPGAPRAGTGGQRPPPLRLDIKWALRRAALALAAVMLLRSLLCYRDYERESYRWGIGWRAVRCSRARGCSADAWLQTHRRCRLPAG